MVRRSQLICRKCIVENMDETDELDVTESSENILELLHGVSATPVDKPAEIEEILQDAINANVEDGAIDVTADFGSHQSDDINVENSIDSHDVNVENSEDSHDVDVEFSQQSYLSSQSTRTGGGYSADESDNYLSNSQPISSQENVIEIAPLTKDEQEECDVQYEFLDFGPVDSNGSESDEVDGEVDADASTSYPSEQENVQQNDFFGMFGLIKKSEVPVEDPNESKLHRNRGGKLRRNIKPRVQDEMIVYGLPSGQSSRENSPRKPPPPPPVQKPVTPQRTTRSAAYLRNKDRVLKQEVEKGEKLRDTAPKVAEQYGDIISRCPLVVIPPSDQPALAYVPPFEESQSGLPRGSTPALAGMWDVDPDIVIKQENLDSYDEYQPVDREIKVEQEDGASVENNDDASGSKRRSARLHGKTHNFRALLNIDKHTPIMAEVNRSANIGKPAQRRLMVQSAIAKRKYRRHAPYTKIKTKRKTRIGSGEEEALDYVAMYEQALSNTGSAPYKVKRKTIDWVNENQKLELQQFNSSLQQKIQKALTVGAAPFKGGCGLPKVIPGHYPALHGMLSGRQIATRPVRPTGKSRDKMILWRTKKKGMEPTENGIPMSQLYPPPEEAFTLREGTEEPRSFIDILKLRNEQISEQKMIEQNYVPVFPEPPIVDRKNELRRHDCRIPHMCRACWINDHMYCKNMKRTDADFRPYGECLHFRPCEHYALREKDSRALLEDYGSLRKSDEQPSTVFLLKSDPKQEDNEVDILGDNEESHAAANELEPSLECDETMNFTDIEPAQNVVRGTEQLSKEIVARSHFIKHSLGVEEIPEFKDIVPSLEPEVETMAWPYIARHGAEIIVASENTWYYPPKHLEMLLKKQVLYGVPPPLWQHDKAKPIQIRTLLKSDYVNMPASKWRMVRRISPKEVPLNNGGVKESAATCSKATPEDTVAQPLPAVPRDAGVEDKQDVIRVRVRKMDPKKIVIQQIMGDKNENVLKETVVKIDEELQKGPENATEKDETKLIGDIIAREALKLVQDRNASSTSSANTNISLKNSSAYSNSSLKNSSTSTSSILKNSSTSTSSSSKNTPTISTSSTVGDSSTSVAKVVTNDKNPGREKPSQVIQPKDWKPWSKPDYKSLIELNKRLTLELLQNSQASLDGNSQASPSGHSQNPKIETGSSHHLELDKIWTTNGKQWEKFTKLYKDSGRSSVDPAAMSDTAKEAKEILQELETIKQRRESQDNLAKSKDRTSPTNKAAAISIADQSQNSADKSDEKYQESIIQNVNIGEKLPTVMSSNGVPLRIDIDSSSLLSWEKIQANMETSLKSVDGLGVDDSSPDEEPPTSPPPPTNRRSERVEQRRQLEQAESMPISGGSKTSASRGSEQSSASVGSEESTSASGGSKQFASTSVCGGSKESASASGSSKESTSVSGYSKESSSAAGDAFVSEAGTERTTQSEAGDGTEERSGADGDTWTFTTKDIREKRPRLINHIKKVGLAPTISKKLQQEKASLQAIIKQVTSDIAELEMDLQSSKAKNQEAQEKEQELLEQQGVYSDRLRVAIQQAVDISRSKFSLATARSKKMTMYHFAQKLRMETQELQLRNEETDTVRSVGAERLFRVYPDSQETHEEEMKYLKQQYKNACINATVKASKYLSFTPATRLSLVDSREALAKKVCAQLIKHTHLLPQNEPHRKKGSKDKTRTVPKTASEKLQQQKISIAKKYKSYSRLHKMSDQEKAVIKLKTEASLAKLGKQITSNAAVNKEGDSAAIIDKQDASLPHTDVHVVNAAIIDKQDTSLQQTDVQVVSAEDIEAQVKSVLESLMSGNNSPFDVSVEINAPGSDKSPEKSPGVSVRSPKKSPVKSDRSAKNSQGRTDRSPKKSSSGIDSCSPKNSAFAAESDVFAIDITNAFNGSSGSDASDVEEYVDFTDMGNVENYRSNCVDMQRSILDKDSAFRNLSSPSIAIRTQNSGSQNCDKSNDAIAAANVSCNSEIDTERKVIHLQDTDKPVNQSLVTSQNRARGLIVKRAISVSNTVSDSCRSKTDATNRHLDADAPANQSLVTNQNRARGSIVKMAIRVTNTVSDSYRSKKYATNRQLDADAPVNQSLVTNQNRHLDYIDFSPCSSSPSTTSTRHRKRPHEDDISDSECSQETKSKKPSSDIDVHPARRFGLRSVRKPASKAKKVPIGYPAQGYLN